MKSLANNVQKTVRKNQEKRRGMGYYNVIQNLNIALLSDVVCLDPKNEILEPSKSRLRKLFDN